MAPNLPPPPPGAASGKTAPRAKPGSYSIGDTKRDAGERVVIYGTRGIGKSTLAACAPGPVFIDAESGARHIEGAKCVRGVNDWDTLMDALQQESLWSNVKTIVLDGGDRIQRWALEFVLATISANNSQATNIEDYGYGKGFGFVMDVFLTLLDLLDAHADQGRNIILVCHDLTTEAPNPTGEDYLRYEPNLQQPRRIGRIRDAVADWCEHLFFIGYDIAMDKKSGLPLGTGRSEERRVGKECRSRWSPYH